MAGLNGLKKKSESEKEDDLVNSFISGAEKRIKDLETRERKFIRYTFSLTEEISDLIDEMIVRSSNARMNRSNIVKIALKALAEKSNEEIREEIQKYK
ncbi:hypothetical protein QDR63_18705 [Acinetobacter baumannii]|uniref:hypothetical protein n=1 Tax=Acinetobacter baumannii TaxID=470 RepID=UPI0024474D9F|nr:hypothetical protein [Acinetobacter baumannii]MDH2528290.1 hypothetical protein [Acinetobacter baumannii]